MKIIATIKEMAQISPDDFETVIRSMICSEETTLKDIIDWLKTMFPYSENNCLNLIRLSIPD